MHPTEPKIPGVVIEETASLTALLYRYLPAIGRFLIVVTFLEDALRIITQWSDQLLYLNDYRHSMLPRLYLYTQTTAPTEPC